MPQRKKYKYYLKKLYTLDRYPRKILRFKKKKWKSLKKRIRKLEQFRYKYNRRRRKKIKKYKNKFQFPDFYKIFVSRRYDRQMKYNYSTNLNYKRLLLIYSNFDSRHFFFDKVKKLTFKKDLYKNLFAKNLYNINNLLFLTLFTRSRLETKKYLESKKLILNGKKNFNNKIIKCGDILFVKSFSFRYKRNRSKISRMRKFFPNYEIDYYSQTLISIKGIQQNSQFDYSYIISNPNLETITKY